MKISILSAVFNEAEHIEEMVGSVLSQSESRWELLFADDGSTDNTVDLIRRFAREDSRIVLVSHGVKLGKVSAFNKAFARSKGDVIVLLAGDDRLPPDSLYLRHRAVAAVGHDLPVVAFFKIRTFSALRKFDGMVLPRGGRSNRSGGSIAMNRTLAEAIFPIEESLVSEDIWLAESSVDLASSIIQNSDVVLEYRIHDGNSNPRNRAFDEMTDSIHARHRAWAALLECDRFALSEPTRRRLAALWCAEMLRYRRKPFRLLLASSSLPITERLALASMASPLLFAVRSRLYRLLSGRRRQ